ncbi:hypothetical protein Pla52o_34250 [Novipirellula galeiformis]|uniref:Uncharacterized protein n=1 Tax=Novipirellula galeiformis TaxID=2528004 RepID=A0A5C6CHZ2_9BACT|nr:hypothetical protein Pla52o_34250 [Novipirellula galeiformis]
MKPSSSRQKLGLAFLVASIVAGVFLSYLWAWHLSNPSGKFPTRWSVFEFSLNIWLVVAVVTTVLFALPLCFVATFSNSSTTLRDYWLTIALAVLVQTAIFAAPRLSLAFNPFLLFVFVLPPLAGLAFLVARRPPTWSGR